ncbi:MAG: MaoC family dehydratase [Pseudomonadota bacterium]
MGHKTNTGWFFEDYSVGQMFHHATPRTVTEGDRTAYQSLYPTRFALTSADAFAQNCGLPRSPVDELITFHIVFGKTVPDISLNAVANLGYADLRFLRPVFPGETLLSRSEVIGLKQNSNGKTGIVWVRTQGHTAAGAPVLQFCRWVMVRKRDEGAPAPAPTVPDLGQVVPAERLVVPEGLDFQDYDTGQAGAPWRWGDYDIGEVIDHVDGITIEEAEHVMATRLWQNTAKVHFNVQMRPDGRRLIYGGHVISLARALSFNGLENAQMIAAINAGTHSNPCFAGDTVYAWSEILDRAETARPDIGALRIRLVATKQAGSAGTLRNADKTYHEDVLLDLDYWTLIPV